MIRAYISLIVLASLLFPSCEKYATNSKNMPRKLRSQNLFIKQLYHKSAGPEVVSYVIGRVITMNSSYKHAPMDGKSK